MLPSFPTVNIPPAAQLLPFLALGVPLFAWRRRPSVPVAGAAVMACGIFGLAALPHLADAGGALQRVAALAVLALWGWCALAFAQDWRGGTRPRMAVPMARFAYGTWVAGTAVTASLIHAALPQWTALYWALCAFAAVLWLCFIPVALTAARALLLAPAIPTITGAILLVTVSTQSLALLAMTLPLRGAASVSATLIVLGALGYGFGLASMLPSLARLRLRRLADEWDNGNCILHGAVSITGLAAVESGLFGGSLCGALWLYAAAMFVVVEVVELLRMAARIGAYGWRAAVFTYSASQWARNFTFGMFYAFTAADHAHFGARAGLAWLAPLQIPVLAIGAQIVLALLIAEAALALVARRE